MKKLQPKHTPGPWLIPDEHLELIEKTNLGLIHIEAWQDNGYGEDGETISIANVVNDTTFSQRVANARLIKAAPDLLQSLKMAVAWVENAGGLPMNKYMPRGVESLDDLRNAINKAEGIK